jgi:hypothetical protein
MTLISSSRANAVNVIVPSLKSAGTGFFLDAQHIVTAFHVVGKVGIDKSKTPPEAIIITGADISVVLVTGETISAQVLVPMATQAPIKLVDPLPYSAQSAIIPVLMDFEPRPPVRGNHKP